MRKAMIGAAVMLVASSAAQATVRSPDVFLDGARSSRLEAPQVATQDFPRHGGLVDEQFRKVAVQKADPYTDGAARPVDPFTDGAIRQVDPFTDGSLAKIGDAEPFTYGA